GDKDLAQLVDAHVTLINTMSGERLDVPGVAEKFGVPPERIVDYLTLVGDAVDNVPGVEKVGPKTAAKWIAEHGSLDGVMAAADAIKGVAGENLRKALDWLPLGRRLVTVKTDCDLSEALPGWGGTSAWDALSWREADREALLDFYTDNDFRAWRHELESARAAAQPAPQPAAGAGGQSALFADPPAADAVGDLAAPAVDKRYETVLTREAFEAWRVRIEAADLVALDTETDSLDGMRARIVGLSFSVQPYEACYIPLAHTYPGAPDQLPLDEVLATLKSWLEDGSRAKLGQNVKYDTHVFANHGIAVRGYVHDTLLQSYVLEAHKPHSLESLASRHLDRKGLSYEDVVGKGAQQIPFAQVELTRATEYSGEDSDMTLDVHRVLWPQLEAAPRLREVYERIEMPTS
ncbi:MAG: 5'-3' exonuclease H3TH domain-containing protein, partial [Methylibium sp.]|nr:5'-3' exonuclease H3TH domain-containing protein [Methylibium sp.]